MPPDRAIIFDLDDTLYPERRFAISGFQAVASHAEREHGVSGRRVFAILVSALKKGARHEGFQRACAALGLPEHLATGWVDVFRRHPPRLRLPRASRDALRMLKPDWRIAILTNGPADVQQRKVEALGVRCLVDAVVFADQHGGGKPAPEAFRAASRVVAVEPVRTLFVGDHPLRDVLGAWRAGMHPVWMVPRRCALASAPGAEAVTRSMADVPAVAERLWREIADVA